ncbi:hypothetical protein [Actinocorallia longicatena]|uniref:hypothetical protein n=1 Tax=Actinocorallia longicatena TaxID=111803 RepID=UPI0031DAA8AE
MTGLLLGCGLLATLPFGGAAAEPAASTLVVHTTVTTATPRSGMNVQAQVWVAATGDAATNATLSFSADPKTGVSISALCTRSPQGYCKLGDVDSGGATVPFTIKLKARTSPVTVTLGVWTRAENVKAAWEYKKIKFRAAAPVSPKPSSTPSSTTPSSPPSTPPSTTTTTPPVSSFTPVVPPTDPMLPTVPTTTNGVTVAPTTSITPGAGGLLTTAPSDVTTYQPPGGESTPPDTSLTGSQDEVPAALALGQSLWLGALLAACALAAVLVFRRGQRVRRRPDDGKHRPKPVLTGTVLTPTPWPEDAPTVQEPAQGPAWGESEKLDD